MSIELIPIPADLLKRHYRNQYAGNYQGYELRAFSNRPGAMDAYTLPSIVNGIRIPRVLPICAPTTNQI